MDELTSKVKENLQSHVRDEVREIEDQKTRTLNLICFHLPECKSKNSEERKQYDTQKFSNLCEQIGVSNPDIKLTFRLGNYSSSNPNPRPLKIILNNKKQRKDIIDNTIKIKNLPGQSGLNKCIIVKDLTKRQREENKKRRAEKLKPAKNRHEATKEQTSVKDVFNDETIHDNTIIEATVTNIGNDNEDVTAMSQPLLQPIYRMRVAESNLTVETGNNIHKSRLSQVSPFSDIGDETMIGGINAFEENALDLSSIQHTDD